MYADTSSRWMVQTENAREVKLLVMPEGLARRFVLEELRALDGR